MSHVKKHERRGKIPTEQMMTMLAWVPKSHGRNKFSVQKRTHVSHPLPVSKFQKKFGPRCSMSLALFSPQENLRELQMLPLSLTTPGGPCQLPVYCQIVKPTARSPVMSSQSHMRYLHSLPSHCSPRPPSPSSSTSVCPSTWPSVVGAKFSSPSDITSLLQTPPAERTSSGKAIVQLFC